MSNLVLAGLRSALNAIEEHKAMYDTLQKCLLLPSGSPEIGIALGELDARRAAAQELESQARHAMVSSARVRKERRRAVADRNECASASHRWPRPG